MGDPTEGALLVAAQQAGVTRAGLEAALPRVAELPFDSDRKRMTTVHELAANVESLPTAVRALPGIDAPTSPSPKGRWTACWPSPTGYGMATSRCR